MYRDISFWNQMANSLFIAYFCDRTELSPTWKHFQDVPGGILDKNLPGHAGGMGLIPGPGRFHRLWGQLSPCTTTTEPVHLQPMLCMNRSHHMRSPCTATTELVLQSPCSATREATALRSPWTAAKSSHPPFFATRESLLAAMKTPQIKLVNLFKKELGLGHILKKKNKKNKAKISRALGRKVNFQLFLENE